MSKPLWVQPGYSTKHSEQRNDQIFCLHKTHPHSVHADNQQIPKSPAPHRGRLCHHLVPDTRSECLTRGWHHHHMGLTTPGGNAWTTAPALRHCNCSDIRHDATFPTQPTGAFWFHLNLHSESSSMKSYVFSSLHHNGDMCECFQFRSLYKRVPRFCLQTEAVNYFVVQPTNMPSLFQPGENLSITHWPRPHKASNCSLVPPTHTVTY